jgi:trehalose 6-phosphate synthase
MADTIQLCNDIGSRYSLIVASNRGPVQYRVINETIEGRRASGGVATALNALVQNMDFIWISSAMGEGDRLATEGIADRALASPIPGHKLHLKFVISSRRIYHKFYNVLCNPLLWFLHHYMWNPPYNPNIDNAIHDAWSTGYTTVNRAFADSILDSVKKASLRPIVLSHDYHLYLVPGFIRDECAEAIIQHYVHVPWPTPRYWQMLPTYMAQAICVSLCKSDIVGFQTDQDVQSFLDCVEVFVPESEVDRSTNTITTGVRICMAKTYPMSVNVEEVRAIAHSARSIEYEKTLGKGSRKQAIVRIERMEPHKNIVRGLKAYELLLKHHRELHGHVVFLALLVPSRTHIQQYRRYMDDIDAVIKHINYTYGTSEWIPIEAFIENNYAQAVAAMKIYDVLLVNTLIEGTNLIAKEGPVVNSCNGVLILSKTSGAYPELASGVLAVTPTDIEGTAEAMYKAVTMDPSERKKFADLLRTSIEENGLDKWLYNQLTDLAAL